MQSKENLLCRSLGWTNIRAIPSPSHSSHALWAVGFGGGGGRVLFRRRVTCYWTLGWTLPQEEMPAVNTMRLLFRWAVTKPELNRYSLGPVALRNTFIVWRLCQFAKCIWVFDPIQLCWQGVLPMYNYCLDAVVHLLINPPVCLVETLMILIEMVDLFYCATISQTLLLKSNQPCSLFCNVITYSPISLFHTFLSVCT